MRPAVQYERPCVGRPMAPSAMASLMAMNLGVQRRWCPNGEPGVAGPALLDHGVGLDQRVGDRLLHVDAADAAGGHVAHDGRSEPRGGRDDDDVELLGVEHLVVHGVDGDVRELGAGVLQVFRHHVGHRHESSPFDVRPVRRQLAPAAPVSDLPDSNFSHAAPPCDV